MSIRLVGLGAMSAPPPRRGRIRIGWVALSAAAAWFPIVLVALWMRGLL